MDTTTNLPVTPSQQMALRISGTKQRQAGFAPLVSVGVLAGNEGVNMDRATTVAEKPVYVIKHASDYILYQVIDRAVKSFDSDASGVLSIALTIPRQFQLSDAQSPYILLKKVYEKFVSEFMRPNNDGRDCFLNTDIDSEVFRSILQNYSLEDRKTKYVTMNPAGLTATLRLSKDKIVDFFRDSQYEELAQFKDIEIGEKCQSFPGLDNLEIPRPVRYDVYVNGKFRTSLSETDSYSSQEKDTNYTYENVSFTLGQLFTIPDGCIVTGKSKVQLDQAKYRIDCTIEKQDIIYNCEIKGSPNNVAAQIENALKTQKIKILINNQDIMEFGGYDNLQIPAKLLSGQHPFSLSSNKYEDYLLKATEEIIEKQHKIILTIIAKPKPGISSTNGSNGNMGKASTISSGQNLGVNHKQDEIQSPPAVSEEDSIAKEKEKEQERNKRERRKLPIVFAIGLLLGSGVGYVIGHYIVPTHQKTEKRVNPSVKKDADPINDKTLKNQETPDNPQREKRVNNWLISSKDKVIEALKKHSKDDISINDCIKALADNFNEEEEKAMLNDILNFESSTELLESYWKEIKDEEEAMRQTEQQRREQEAAKATAKAEARKEILNLVNNRNNLSDCRNHRGWNEYLTDAERGAIEAILDMSKYKGVSLRRVRDYLANKKFEDYKSIIDAQKEIWRIIQK